MTVGDLRKAIEPFMDEMEVFVRKGGVLCYLEDKAEYMHHETLDEAVLVLIPVSESSPTNQ